MRTVKDLSSEAASIITRKTQLQDHDARELVIDALDPEGVATRSTSWLTIRGTQAIIFNFQVPAAHAPELEPFFKIVVQSVTFPNLDRSFEILKSSTLKPATVGPLDELQNAVAALNDATSERDSAIARLATLLAPPTDAAVDLLADRRPLVRLGAVQAAVRSNNSALTPLLWELLDDQEPLVAEAAARGLAPTPDILTKLIQKLGTGFNGRQTIARMWPFLPKAKRNELLEHVFKETAVHPPRLIARVRPRDSVTVIARPMTPVQPGKPAPIMLPAIRDPNVQMGALMLLMSEPREDFKLPFAKLVASNYDRLIFVGLQTAFMRHEPLPVASLSKLVSSSNEHVSKLAAMNFAFSASASDIPLIESLIARTTTRKELHAALKLAVKEINFRQQLESAKTSGEKQELVEKALSDAAIAGFAWLFHCEITAAGCTPNTPPLKRDLVIKPFAENLFPTKVQHYTAIPNPGQAVQNFYQTLHGLQMDSPRAQSNLVLTMGNVRRLIGFELSAPVDAETLIEYSGIDPDSPIALASWTPRHAPEGLRTASRRAIVLRVKDRARFERVLERLQRLTGSAANLADSLGIGTRAMAALPALLPLIAEAIISLEPDQPRSRSVFAYSTVGDKEWNGLRIKTFEHAWTNSESSYVEQAVTNLVYFGDTAIITPDLGTLRELLANASDSKQLLADNAEFRHAIERGRESPADAFYFSDLKAVFAETMAPPQNSDFKVNERGAFKFSSSSWENSHQLVFAESEWSKPLLPFNPKELTAARDLLPASTVAYFLTKVDVSAAWSTWLKDAFAKRPTGSLPNLATLNLTEDVLTELGPECGLAVLELPNSRDFSGGSWAAFCKLKSNKLVDALAAGKLFTSTGQATGPAELKIGDETYFVSARNGFLVVSNQAQAFAAPDDKSSLATTRDYTRSAEKVPDNIVAFGGYNLEAALAAVKERAGNQTEIFIANVFFSLAAAFHSQNFYATVTAGAVAAHSSVAMDREGRYAIADFSYLPRGTNITYAVIDAGGVPITDHTRVSRLVLKVRAKAPGPIDNIKDDIETADQIVEQKSSTELLVTVAARRPGTEKALQLPIKNPELAEYLKATAEFAADKKEVIDKAREIAGNDRDAWSVAQKLADWTHKNLEWKFVVRADAVQTLATREADCTEFSELFVGMARSLGLPARMVSGLAYNGSSFGGHAWVEVWIGKWIELDPTWGTSFVDATHIRNADDRLLTSAGLKLIELEVVETSRSAAEFQKTPRALAEHLVKVLPAGNKPEIEAAIDITTLTELHMGAGAWAKLSDRERDQLWSTYRKVLVEIVVGYGQSDFGKPDMRLLHVEEKGDTAEAICLWNPLELLVKLRFLRRNDVWHLVEVEQADTGLAIATEQMQTTIAAIEKVRAGEKPSEIGMSDFIRVLLLMEKDAAKSVVLADELLKAKPKDTGLRFLKAMALIESDKASDGEKLMRELSAENYAPAVYRLANYLNGSEKGEYAQTAIEMFKLYTKLEPHDSRGFSNLGYALHAAESDAEAEVAYRKAIELDPVKAAHYQNLIELLLTQERFSEVKPLLAAGEKVQKADEDLFGSIMRNLLFLEKHQTAEKFAASEPSRMKTNVLANLSLARMLANDNRYVEAERYFNAAALLDKKSTEPPIGLAMLYRKQSRWADALKAANKAISLDAEDSEGHYQRACALTRLRRFKEALVSLTKAVELDAYQADYIVDEEDLKPLHRFQEFKKLIPEPEKPQPEQPRP
ncbi:MAG TPA: transglutaminase domain-containing protein [Pyrinomonadaceae bacterium]|nr:transglutaminase domain-containing protein [Pyrinomonadaceae bacterium]